MIPNDQKGKSHKVTDTAAGVRRERRKKREKQLVGMKMNLPGSS